MRTRRSLLNAENVTDCLWIAAAVFVLAGIVAAITDAAMGRWQPEQSAVIVERTHIAAQTHTYVSLVSNGKCSCSPVVTTSYDPERWNVVFSVGGRAVSQDTNSQTWSACSPDRRVRVSWRKGRYSGINWGWRINAAADW